MVVSYDETLDTKIIKLYDYYKSFEFYIYALHTSWNLS